MKHYSRLAKKIIRCYLKSNLLKGNINSKSEYKLLRNQFKKCKFCYLFNKEKYGKSRLWYLRELSRRYKRTN